LREASAEVTVVEHDERIAGLDRVILLDAYLCHERDLRKNRHDVAVDLRVVGRDVERLNHHLRTPRSGSQPGSRP